MGKSGSETVTQERIVPPFLQPFLEEQSGVETRALQRLESNLGQTAGAVAPLTGEQRQAIDLLTARAGGAGGFLPAAQQAALNVATSPLAPVATGALQQFATRDILSDPAIREATTAAVRQILPDISSAFAASGRTGSGLERAAIGQATSDSLVGLLGQERQRQLQAAGILGELSNAERMSQLRAAGALPGLAMADPNLLLQSGGLLQQQAQRELEGPISAQERILAAAGGLPVSSLVGQATTSPLHQNTAAGVLGGALAGGIGGAELGGLIGSGLGPVGGVLGALLGGVAGGFA